MWIVIIYACFANNICAFIDSPPTYSEIECQKIMAEADVLLERDPRVVVHDSKCVRVQMSQG